MYPSLHWSPRRGHAALYFNNRIFLFGGRAREYVILPEEKSVGGIIGPRIQDIAYTRQNHQEFSTQREVSMVKGDVWSSEDGLSWSLVTPGCHQNQKELTPLGNDREGKRGYASVSCSSDSDCYGAEVCSPTYHICECGMWSPREQLSVAQYGGFLYVSGGYASQLYSQLSNCGPYACGDMDASAYRYYLNDIWSSPDGLTWTQLPPAQWSPRGGHNMLTIPDLLGNGYLWVFGGRGGNNLGSGEEVYYNDVWRAAIGKNSPTLWEKLSFPSSSPMWTPRTGHSVIYEPKGEKNRGVRSIYVVGGIHPKSGLSVTAPHLSNGSVVCANCEVEYLDDVWQWRMDLPNEPWRKDFTADAIFSSGDKDQFHYSNHSPALDYLDAHSDVSYLQRFWVPVRKKPLTIGAGLRLEKRVYLSKEKEDMLKSVGVNTINDLANIDKMTVLKLRGYDYPQVPREKRLTFTDICDYRALAIAITKKCSINSKYLYESEWRMPWNIEPVFGGPPPPSQNILWHDRENYNFMLPAITDPKFLLEHWDGCTYLPQIEGLFGPNVNGLGYVQQVKAIRDPQPELVELFCKQTPGPRAFHGAVMFEERLYLLGGKENEKTFHADSWYRDSQLPTTRFSRKPTPFTPQSEFHFSADEPGAVFEYRVWDPINYKLLKDWTAVTKKTDIGWLNWRMGGPGNGEYTLYVRAVDPAGNRDETYSSNRNVYTWRYVSPIPWDIIFEVLGSFGGLCLFSYIEYRRRVRKAAMERYAMKRMRRKFKAMQRDMDGRAVDWRTLYMESKEAEDAALSSKKKKAAKDRDRKKEKREKDKKKREKEKEQLKKKLRSATKGSAPPSTAGTKDNDPSKPTSGTSISKKNKENRGGKGKGVGGGDSGSVSEGGGGEDVKAKGKEKRFKSYELEGGAGGAGGGGGGDEGGAGEKKFKSYELEARNKADKKDL